ncbi:UDP-glucose 4-epimerase GalE [Maricaulis sp.]|uniref:UDP-glucose 4-epimerase GalE n=1 Tax=Maricaulis sp. TaxID=1486257 RepID=UPI003A954D2D
MARILVTGGAGYIGAHVCRALAARGDQPIVFDNLSTGHRHAVQWGPLVTGDIRSPADLDQAFQEHRPQAVMHFAASIEVGEGQQKPLQYWENNVGGLISLLGAMGRSGVKPIVFSSSCAVYGEPSSVPIRENENRAPVSVYGQTKLAAELLLADMALTGDARFVALRYFNAAGASPDGEIGEEHEPETHLIPNALKIAAGLGRDRLKLFGSDYDTRDGTCLRDYIHVVDLAAAHLAALDRVIAGPSQLFCNVGTGQGATVLEVLQAIERITGARIPYDIHPRRPGDPAALLADTSLARAELGFQPRSSSIDQIITDAWKFHARKWQV